MLVSVKKRLKRDLQSRVVGQKSVSEYFALHPARRAQNSRIEPPATLFFNFDSNYGDLSQRFELQRYVTGDKKLKSCRIRGKSSWVLLPYRLRLRCQLYRPQPSAKLNETMLNWCFLCFSVNAFSANSLLNCFSSLLLFIFTPVILGLTHNNI